MKSSLISVDADISVKLGLWKPSKPDHDWKGDKHGKDKDWEGKHGKDKDHDRDYGKGKDHDRDHDKHADKGKDWDKDWKDGKHGKDKDHDREHGKDKDYDRDHGKHARKDDDCDDRSKGHDDDDCDLQAVLCSLPDVCSVLDCAISHLDCGSDCYDAPQCDTDLA